MKALDNKNSTTNKASKKGYNYYQSKSDIKALDTPNINDSIALKAQDYNSSRSNKARGEAAPNDDFDNPNPNDSLQTKANINTSRSNIKK